MKKRFKVEIELVAEIDESLSVVPHQTDEPYSLLNQFVGEFAKDPKGLSQFYTNYFLEQFFETEYVNDGEVSVLFNYQTDNCQAIFLEAASRCPQEVDDYMIHLHQAGKKDSLADRWNEQQLMELDNFFGPLKLVKANFYSIDHCESKDNK